jgi:short-subunit dehydrogenase
MPQPVAIVTGASSGIGSAAARMLGSKGYRVVIAARRQERLEEVAASIREVGGEALVVPADLGQLDQIRDLVAKTLQTFGHIDLLVNSAGYAKLVWLEEQPQEEIGRQIQVNLVGAIQLIREVLPSMLDRGSGQIIQIVSAASWVGLPTYSIYAANKFGLRGFLESLRRELRGTGITVSGIYPGAVDTEFDQHAGIEWEFKGVTPPWLLYSPEDVAACIWRVIKNRKRSVVFPGIMLLAILINAHFPRLVGWLLSKWFYRVEGKTVAWQMQPKK